MKNLAATGGPVAAGITAAIAAAKAFIGILKEGTEAYKVQEKAEGALQAAAANNPYLSAESVQRLKDYAFLIPLLNLEFPHFLREPLYTILILPRQVVDFLYGVVNLLYACRTSLAGCTYCV